MKKLLFALAIFIQSFNIIFAEEGPCPDTLIGGFIHSRMTIGMLPCPGQQNYCIIEVKFSHRVVKDLFGTVISREVMIEDYTITNCDCYNDKIKETILRACFRLGADYNITAPGTYTNIKVFSKSCYRQEVSPSQYSTAFIPCEGIVCCMIEYRATYVENNGKIILDNMIKIGEPQVQLIACYNTCVFTCNDWPIWVDNNPNTAPDIDVTYPPGPLPRLSDDEFENAENIVISKGSEIKSILIQKLRKSYGEKLDFDNELSGIILYGIEGQVLFHTQKSKGFIDEFSVFADNLGTGVYFIEAAGIASKKVYKIIITN